jgi:hypothetical protein
MYAVITSNANFNGMDISYMLNERPSDLENWSTITTARVVDHAVAMYIAQFPDATIPVERGVLQNRITVAYTPDTPVVPPVVGATEPATDYASVLVPLRATAEDLGATVEWNGETRAVTVTTPGGETIIIDNPLIIDSLTFVTVGFIREVFDVNFYVVPMPS